MRAVLLGVALALLIAAPASAAPQLVKIGDFDQPVHVATPPRATQLYVVEKPGRIKIVGGGTFLDVTSITDDDQERGLLSMAFSPNYASDGLFYVFLTATGGGDLKVLEFQRSAADPSRSNPTPRRELLSIDHPNPQPYHNGGQLQIGPDGMLYVSTGEGHDRDNAEDTSSPLGKILRLNPITGNAAADNPYGNAVWSWGLRNPWRFSFDRATGDIAIGDVGDQSWEEINWGAVPNRGKASNFGWPDSEGDGSTGTDPIVAHNHNEGFCAIVGGYVVRDAGLPTLNGRYLYGDNCEQDLYTTTPRTGAGDEDPVPGLSVTALSSFGEDACGHIYAASLSGPVYRLQDGAVSPCSFGGQPADTAPPGLAVGVGGVRKLLKTRRLRVSVRCSEACQVEIGTRLRNVRRLATRHRTLVPQERKVVRLKLSKATMKRLRTRVRRRGFVRIAVSVRATDAAGNVKTVTKRGRVKRRR
jgi:glucose/sorbosone dehydrogenase